MLDSEIFSSIIYILYEGGPLSPPVVTATKLSCHVPRRNNGEEDCEGRQEKGRKEALGHAAYRSRGCLHDTPYFLMLTFRAAEVLQRCDRVTDRSRPACREAAALQCRVNPSQARAHE
jgi:hypothetical protein